MYRWLLLPILAATSEELEAGLSWSKVKRVRAENVIRSAELVRRTSRRDEVPPWCDRYCTGVTCSRILRIRSQIVDGRFQQPQYVRPGHEAG